jgi:transposase
LGSTFIKQPSWWRVRRRAERLYEQLDMLRHLRQQARRELLAESRKHAITAKLRQIPYLGPIRSALAVALIQTPHRFRTKRQLWAYSGLALETRISAEYRLVEGQVRRSFVTVNWTHYSIGNLLI